MDKNTTASSIRTLNPGNHISCIYRTNEELFAFIVPFFIDGLQKHNKCIFILGEQSSDEVMQAFSNSGFDLSPYILAKAFTFASSDDIYFKSGVFNKEEVIANLISFESDALKQGFTALRVTGSVSGIAKEVSNIPELIKYEAQVSDFIEYSFIIAACLYKESLFDYKTLAETLRKHPLVYLYDKLIKNTYFIPLSSQPVENSKELTYEEITRNLYK